MIYQLFTSPEQRSYTVCTSWQTNNRRRFEINWKTANFPPKSTRPRGEKRNRHIFSPSRSASRPPATAAADWAARIPRRPLLRPPGPHQWDSAAPARRLFKQRRRLTPHESTRRRSADPTRCARTPRISHITERGRRDAPPVRAQTQRWTPRRRWPNDKQERSLR